MNPNIKMFNHVKLDIPERPFVKMLDRNDGHYYETNDGKIYPSITTVLSINTKEGIDIWRSKVGRKEADRISKSSMEVGTKMHELIENYLSNKQLSMFDDSAYEKSPLELFEVVKPMLDEKIDNIHAIETKLYSDELELAGTVDCIAEFDGVLSIIDFKNSRKPKTPSRVKNYYQQGAAYSTMWKECMNMDIEQVVIIVASWDNKVRAFTANVNDHKSALWNTLLKYEQNLIN